MTRPPVQAQPQIPPVIDPDNVPETLCFGPFNFAITGPVTVITFTQNRPDAAPIFSNGTLNVRAVVRARLAIATPDLTALRNSIDQLIQAAAAAAGNAPPITTPVKH
jgi:hypothetical protein